MRRLSQQLTMATIAMVRIWCWISFPRQTVAFRLKLGRWPDPALPKRRNDKYAWRKAFDRNPLFTEVSDKLKAKAYATHKCPKVKVAQTLWRGSNARDIPAPLLAGNVVVKANHGSGWNYFIENGQYDRRDLLRLTDGWMRKRYGRRNAEWGYYGVEPRLFVEEMLFDNGGRVANEYKFYVGQGKVAFAFVRQSGPQGERLDGVLDDAGQAHPGNYDSGVLSSAVTAPSNYDDLQSVALKISEEFDFVRCDLLLVNGEIYFSELTLYTVGGYAWIDDDELNDRYTQLWDLRTSWFLQTPQSGWRRIYAEALRHALTRPAEKVDHGSGK